MLLPPIATLIDEHSTPDSPESIHLDLDEDTRSPSEDTTLGNSLGTLTTLFEFYHYERRWIHQQRNSLQDDPGLDPACRDSSNADERATSSSSSSSLSDEPTKFMALKAEPEEVCISDSLKSRTSLSTLRFSRWPWSARMREPFELKPGVRSFQHRGLSEPRLILPPAGQRTGSPADDFSSSLVINDTESPSDTALLDLFESMMEARLESCQRIDRIVRRAHGRQTVDQGGFYAQHRRMTRS